MLFWKEGCLKWRLFWSIYSVYCIFQLNYGKLYAMIFLLPLTTFVQISQFIFGILLPCSSCIKLTKMLFPNTTDFWLFAFCRGWCWACYSLCCKGLHRTNFLYFLCLWYLQYWTKLMFFEIILGGTQINLL